MKAGDRMGIFRRSIKNETKTITLQELNEYFENTKLEKDVDTYLPDEEMFMTAYSFETIQKI